MQAVFPRALTILDSYFCEYLLWFILIFPSPSWCSYPLQGVFFLILFENQTNSLFFSRFCPLFLLISAQMFLIFSQYHKFDYIESLFYNIKRSSCQ